MEISCWSYRVTNAATSGGDRRRLGSPGILGLLGTLLLHALVLQSVLLGTRAHKVRPPEIQGPGATLVKSSNEAAEALILVELPSVDMKAQALPEEIASVGSAPRNFLVTMIGSDPLPHIDIPPDNMDDNAKTPAAVDSGDPRGRALLFGRYIGQIQARIERAWRRPRSPVSDEHPALDDSVAGAPGGVSPAYDSFRCQVRILQDGHGAVQEVQMLSCNGTVTWQQSLVTAILSASPLPAPPDPAVFTPSLTMAFEGQTFGMGSPLDDYDIDRTAAASMEGTYR